MVEEAHAREGHRHAVLVCGGDHLRIADRAARRDDVVDAARRGHVDRVAEGEEGVRRQRDAVERLEVRADFFAAVSS